MKRTLIFSLVVIMVERVGVLLLVIMVERVGVLLIRCRIVAICILVKHVMGPESITRG